MTNTEIRFMAARSTPAQIENALAEMTDGSVRMVALEVFDHPLAVDTDGQFGAGPGKLGHVVLGPPERVRAWLVEGGFDDYDEVAEAGVPDLTPLDSAGSVPDMTNTEAPALTVETVYRRLHEEASVQLVDAERMLKLVEKDPLPSAAGFSRLVRAKAERELAADFKSRGLPYAVAQATYFVDTLMETSDMDSFPAARQRARAARKFLTRNEELIIEVLPLLYPSDRQSILENLISG